jgi:GT2 family glycosyltransferase
MTPKPSRAERAAPSVVIAWLSPGQVSHYFVESLSKTILLGYRDRWLANILPEWSSANVSAARNTVTERFLDGPGDPEWLLWVDSDMQWDPEAITDLLAVADPKERPIVGGLCFGMSGDAGMYPTIYMGYETEAGEFTTIRVRDYPRNTLVRVAATGAAFLLIHRTVLEKMRAHGFDRAFPFFAESSGNGKPVGEDITFCIRAGILGFPVYVHTGVLIGHHKSALLTEAEFEKQLPPGLPPGVGLVIPTRGDHPELLRAIVATSGLPPEMVVIVDTVGGAQPLDLPDATVVVDTGPLNIHRWWNAGIDLLAQRGCTRVAVLNDDVVIAPDTLPKMARALGSATLALASEEGTSGHCWMLNTGHGVRPDESYRWYSGDLQLCADASDAGGLVRVPDAWCLHLHATKSTESNPVLSALAEADDALYDERHPEGSPHTAIR